jgi:hypothetical protein
MFGLLEPLLRPGAATTDDVHVLTPSPPRRTLAA